MRADPAERAVKQPKRIEVGKSKLRLYLMSVHFTVEDQSIR